MNARKPTAASLPGSGASRRRVVSATAIATVLWFGLLCFSLHGTMTPVLFNDSYQYLSVAQNLLAGHGAATSLLHFDAERSFGLLPAPMVTFPMGFPLLLAALAKLGVPLPQAALVLNVGAMGAVLWLVALAVLRLRLPTGLIIAGLIALAANAGLIRFTAMALSEALFTLLSTAGVLLLVLPPPGQDRWSDDSVASWPRSLTAGVLIGLAYHVRYAGLFFLVALVALAGLAVVRGDRQRAKRAVFAAAVAAPIMAVGLVRNALLVGTWRGGNAKIVTHSLLGMLETTIRSFDDLLLGLRTAPILSLLHGLFLLLALVYLIYRGRRDGLPRITDRSPAHTVGLELIILIFTYCACMFYAGLTTVISYSTRMFVPILPLLVVTLLCLFAQWPRADRRKTTGAALLASCLGLLYIGTNLGTLATIPPEDRTEAVRNLLWQPDEHGVSAAETVSRVAGTTGTIIANDGQAVGYVLNLKTLSLITQNFSTTAWTEANVRACAQQYGTSAVVLLRPQPDQAIDPDLVPSAFVGELASGHHPPWLALVFKSPRAVVYGVRLGEGAGLPPVP